MLELQNHKTESQSAFLRLGYESERLKNKKSGVNVNTKEGGLGTDANSTRFFSRVTRPTSIAGIDSIVR